MTEKTNKFRLLANPLFIFLVLLGTSVFFHVRAIRQKSHSAFQQFSHPGEGTGKLKIIRSLFLDGACMPPDPAKPDPSRYKEISSEEGLNLKQLIEGHHCVWVTYDSLWYLRIDKSMVHYCDDFFFSVELAGGQPFLLLIRRHEGTACRNFKFKNYAQFHNIR